MTSLKTATLIATLGFAAVACGSDKPPNDASSTTNNVDQSGYGSGSGGTDVTGAATPNSGTTTENGAGNGNSMSTTGSGTNGASTTGTAH